MVSQSAGDINAHNGTFAGTLTADNMVNTPHLVANAVTIPVGVGYADTVYSDHSSELVIAQAGPFTSNGGPVYISGDALVGCQGGHTARIELRRNGTAIRGISFIETTSDATNPPATTLTAFNLVETPGAGSVYYQLIIWCDGGSSSTSASAAARSLFTLECKR